MNEKQQKQTPGSPSKKGGGPQQRYNKSPFSWLIIALIALSVILMVNRVQNVDRIKLIPDFYSYIEKGYISSVELHTNKITGKFSSEGLAARGDSSNEAFELYVNPDLIPEITNELRKQGIPTITAEPDIWGPLLWQILPIIVLVGLIYFFFIRGIRAGGGGGMLMSFGRSKHRLRGKEHTKVTFKDVAGIEEAKDEVAETIDFLKNPKKFQKIGGRIPRGVLLVGPPGCGKTLLAKAIAGESDVPFFSISGSDFVEMFVGVGASRVRDLFKQAKENSPCIIFLDEIDAIGRKRGPGVVSGGHDEREQTLNAILVEMDGFDTNDQVIVIAATNRGDILDHALTRPGRFDRQVVVPLPDLGGRLEILKVHAKKVKMSPDINLERIARGTPMFSGAELEALINEAAIGASMADKDHVEMFDLEEARDKVKWGRAKRSRVVDEDDKRLTAYHEAGHAMVQYMLEDTDPLHKVSIIPRGPMGGATFALPEKDRMFYTKKYCVAQLQVCYAGRIAEEIFCHDVDSGAQSDIKQASSIAREMVMSWGMGDEVGPVYYGASNSMFNSYYPSEGPDYSQSTAEIIDREIKKILEQAYKASAEIIQANKDKIDTLAQALLKYETLDVEEVKIILDGGTLEKPTVAELLAKEQEKSEVAEKDKQEKEDSAGQQSDEAQGSGQTEQTVQTDDEQKEHGS